MSTGRKLMLGAASLFGAGGLGLTVFANGSGVPLIFMSGLMFIGVLLERRYGRPGQQKSIPHSRWELTGERFHDDETGEPVEVWIDPLTGERRYEPLGDHPRISDKRTHR